ncbi:lipid-transfer protein [Dietzia sp.]|uniref:lipid-transfer protein n=1 Tax=Dietzia sp. TaxID=1871616 RepID=UPI002FD9931D
MAGDNDMGGSNGAGPREVAVVGFAHAAYVPETPGTTNGVEMLAPVFARCFEQTGLDRTGIDFWCSGSSDYLAGRAFSFISALDSIGAHPPVQESHVEGDAAWALFEAWLTIGAGHADTALVYGFGKASASGDLDASMAMSLDPYTQSPLWPGRHHLAALQARAGIDSGRFSREDMDAVVERVHGRGAADAGEGAGAGQGYGSDEDVAPPLGQWDVPPVTDGACAVILAAGDRARELCARPAWIAGMGQAIDSAEIGGRDLATSLSVRRAAELAAAAGAGDTAAVDVAELHTPYSHQELIVRSELGLGDGVEITPSGGAMFGDPLFSAGLERIGYAARAIHEGRADRALGHATGGHLLQQNLVAVLEGRDER